MTLTTPTNPHPTLTLEQGVSVLAPKPLSHPSLGHRPRNSNRRLNKRYKRASIERADRTGAGSESRFQRSHFLCALNPGALPQARAEHAPPLALHIDRRKRRKTALTSSRVRALVWASCKRLDSRGKVNRVR